MSPCNQHDMSNTNPIAKQQRQKLALEDLRANVSLRRLAMKTPRVLPAPKLSVSMRIYGVGEANGIGLVEEMRVFNHDKKKSGVSRGFNTNRGDWTQQRLRAHDYAELVRFQPSCVCLV